MTLSLRIAPLFLSLCLMAQGTIIHATPNSCPATKSEPFGLWLFKSFPVSFAALRNKVRTTEKVPYTCVEKCVLRAPFVVFGLLYVADMRQKRTGVTGSLVSMQGLAVLGGTGLVYAVAPDVAEKVSGMLNTSSKDRHDELFGDEE